MLRDSNSWDRGVLSAFILLPVCYIQMCGLTLKVHLPYLDFTLFFRRQLGPLSSFPSLYNWYAFLIFGHTVVRCYGTTLHMGRVVLFFMDFFSCRS